MLIKFLKISEIMHEYENQNFNSLLCPPLMKGGGETTVFVGIRSSLNLNYIDFLKKNYYISFSSNIWIKFNFFNFFIY